VEAIADRLLVINSGRLVFDGTPAELAGAGSLEERFYELIQTPPADVDAAVEVGDRK
jgi:ABC-type multidrug transport system ATPase subunit